MSFFVALGAVAALAFGGCSSSSGLAAPATGSLTVTITAPAGVTPSVAVNGPGGYHQTLSATQTLSGLAAGSYAVTGAAVRGTNAIVASVYTASVTGGAAVVGAGATAMASVSYGAQPGSGALWVSNVLGATVLAYTATQLAASTSAAPATALGTGTNNGTNNYGVAIDAAGNLWVAELSRNTVVEYTASQLAASGSPTPAVTLSATAGSLNGPAGLAFDGGGNLWVVNAANTLVEFTTPQLASSGSPTPAVTLSDNGAGSLSAPFGLAFDRSGNLWILNDHNNTVVAYSPSQLAANSSPTPAVTLSDDGAGSINEPLGLAFDGGGNLWVANYFAHTVVEFTSSQLASTGSPTPAVTLTSTAGGLANPAGLAFDAAGTLWVASFSSSGTVLAFAPSQLVTSGAPTANVTVGGSSIDGPFGLAFDPHASNMPKKP